MVLCLFTLNGCGSKSNNIQIPTNHTVKKDNKEEMISQAMVLDWEEVYDEYLSNEARADNKYGGKIVKWTGTIYDINTIYVRMANETYNGLPLNAICVYLSKDDIAKLDKYTDITVVGKFSFGAVESQITNAFIVE